MAEPHSSGSRISSITGIVRAILLATIVGYLAFRIYSGRSTIAALQLRWDVQSLSLALLSAFVAYQSLFVAWLILLRRSGYYAPTYLRQYLRIWWVSFMYRYVPGKVLLVIERARMGAEVGIPVAAGAALTIVETLLAILAGCAVSLLAVSYYADADGRMLGIVLLLMFGAMLMFPAAFRWLRDLPFFRKKYPELGGVALGYRDIFFSVLPYVFHYLLLGLSFFLVSRSLQLFSWSDLPGLCGIYALSHVISLIALVAPGGLGVREGALAVQLARFIPAGLAEALAIGIRIWFTLVELTCYLGVLFFCRSSRERFRS